MTKPSFGRAPGPRKRIVVIRMIANPFSSTRWTFNAFEPDGTPYYMGEETEEALRRRVSDLHPDAVFRHAAGQRERLKPLRDKLKHRMRMRRAHVAAGEGSRVIALSEEKPKKAKREPKALKHPREMQAAEINREVEALRKKSGKITSQFIEAGRGEERPSDYHKKTDPLSTAANEVSERQRLLYNEIERRMGPGVKRYVLPRGFGPIRT